MSTSANHPGRWWHRLDDGRIQCDLCPRDCRLHEGQRGACFVRAREGDAMVLTTYGRSSGFCIDPVEKKPLNHFYPGSSILSFGTAGCNLACKFCQNWDISKSREMDTLMDAASPDAIAKAAKRSGARSVAFTYNDPVIFAEYAMDTADACREQGVATVAVTAGYIGTEARREFFAKMDAANVDLKGFTDEFYVKLCGAHLAPVLDTLVYLKHGTSCWFELTTLLIPGKNDSAAEIEAMSRWIVRELGPDVPLHLTAFHPDYKMTDLTRDTAGDARALARDRAGRGCPIRLHGQRARQDGRNDVLPRLREASRRPRLARDPRLRPHRRRELPALRDGDPGPVRALRRRLRIPAHPDPDERGGVSRAVGPGIAGRHGIRWSWRFLQGPRYPPGAPSSSVRPIPIGV